MCLAIVSLPNSQIPEIYLRRAFLWNHDGFGLSYNKNNKLVTRKGLWGIDRIIYEINKIPKDAHKLIHFRAASHGTIGGNNCHPFKINEDYVLIHNGCIPRFGEEKRSDTRHYVEEVLTPLFKSLDKNILEDPSFLDRLWFKYMIFTGTGQDRGMSKFAILHKTGKYHIFGEPRGVWEEGNWYSNSYSISMTPAENEQLLLEEKMRRASSYDPDEEDEVTNRAAIAQAYINAGGAPDDENNEELTEEEANAQLIAEQEEAAQMAMDAIEAAREREENRAYAG